MDKSIVHGTVVGKVNKTAIPHHPKFFTMSTFNKTGLVATHFTFSFLPIILGKKSFI